MLDDGQFQDVVSWGVDGSSFVVKVRPSLSARSLKCVD